MAVAQCKPTRKAKYDDSLADSLLTTLPQCSNPGTSTEWPKLETGKSSVIPWSKPNIIAWKYVITLPVYQQLFKLRPGGDRRCGPK